MNIFWRHVISGGVVLAFVVANVIHWLRPVSCMDCYFPYGVPFTVYHAGGYAGDAAIVWSGLAADLVCLLVAALLPYVFVRARNRKGA
jgi:hypothetical protein